MNSRTIEFSISHFHFVLGRSSHQALLRMSLKVKKSSFVGEEVHELPFDLNLMVVPDSKLNKLVMLEGNGGLPETPEEDR